ACRSRPADCLSPPLLPALPSTSCPDAESALSPPCPHPTHAPLLPRPLLRWSIFLSRSRAGLPANANTSAHSQFRPPAQPAETRSLRHYWYSAGAAPQSSGCPPPPPASYA